MPSLPWLRLHREIIHDPKLRRLPHPIRWLWITCLCLAAGADDRGTLELAPGIPYTIADLADAAQLAPTEVAAGLAQLAALNMLTPPPDDTTPWHVTHWHERQYESASTPRVRRHRERQRYSNVTGNAPGNVTPPVSETPPDTDTDTEPDADTESGGSHAAPQSIPSSPLRDLWTATAAHIRQHTPHLAPALELATPIELANSTLTLAVAPIHRPTIEAAHRSLHRAITDATSLPNLRLVITTTHDKPPPRQRGP